MAKPTHLVKMKSRDRDKKDTNTIGVAWLNEGGSITLILNKGVVLSWRDFSDHIVTIFKFSERDGGGAGSPDDEIPF